MTEQETVAMEPRQMNMNVQRRQNGDSSSNKIN